ncbi:MAG: DPP IV N-terminal domain-containing protein, partial [Chloroflexota bacterium]|nr:DPP IV N-terminal domain-containing protein [Chloroflexota bacterium]
HTQNPPIFHRDIKPGNVKITPEGIIFLVDFGLAKMAYGGQRTTTGARAMTPGYSPPEQYGGARTDHRSDIYSLAATLYASLAGTIPEDGLARTMEQAELTPLRDHNPDVSRRFAKAIEKGLEVHPDDRYQDAKDFKQALYNASSPTIRREAKQGVLEPLPLSDGEAQESSLAIEQQEEEYIRNGSSSGPIPVSRPLSNTDFQPLPKPRPNRRRGCFVSLILFIILLIAGSGLVYFFNPLLAKQILQAVPIDIPLQLLASTTPTASYTPSLTNTSTVSPTILPTTKISIPTATYTVDQLPTETLIPTITNTPTITLTPTITQTPTITPTPTATQTPTRTQSPTIDLSATATPMGGGYGQVAFASDRTGITQIWIKNSDGSGLRQVTKAQLGACQPNWSPSGERLVFISPCEENKEKNDTASLFIINADGSGMTPLPTTGRGDYDPAWSPDGEYITFTSLRMGYRPQVYIMNLESQEVQRLSTGDYQDFQPEWSPDGSKIVFITTRNGPYQLWTMNIDGTEPWRFSASKDWTNTDPVWSHNGQIIIFTQKEAGGIPRLIGARYPDGGVAEFEIYPFPGSVPMREADYSPDDYWVAFESWPEGQQHDVFIMRTNGGDLAQLTTDSGYNFDAAWRPIGP